MRIQVTNRPAVYPEPEEALHQQVKCNKLSSLQTSPRCPEDCWHSSNCGHQVGTKNEIVERANLA